MKIRDEQVLIERSDNIIESTFGISAKDSAHILSILRDKLYSDKILAVIREYCTNARDAHVEVGKLDLPIQVSLPGPIDPTFRVRDFGPGLSEEEVRAIYVMYGASTKRNTNQQVGMLGLGSKSFFAYTDRFHITSWFGGEKKVYCAYIDETKCGKIALLSTEASEEPDGIEVSGPVQQRDFSRFVTVAKQILLYFKPLPEISGATLEVPKYLLTGEVDEVSYGIYQESGDGPQVIMGGIPYSLDKDKLEYPSYNGTAEEVYSSNFLGLDIDIIVPIGLVDVAANRESLEYTKTTIANLRKVILLCANHASDNVLNLLSKASSLKEANILFQNLKAQKKFWGLKDHLWNGYKITGQVIPTEKYCEIYKPSSYKTRNVRKWHNIYSVPAEEDIIIFEIDKSDWKKKVSDYIDYNIIPHNKVYVIKWREGIENYKELAIKENHLEDWEIKKTSDCIIPKQAVTRTGTSYGAKSTSHIGNIFLLLELGQRPSEGIRSEKWKKAITLAQGEKFYVPIDVFLPLSPDGIKNLELGSLDSYIALAQTLKVNVTSNNFYGVKVSYLKKIEKNPEWKNLYEAVKEAIIREKIPELKAMGDLFDKEVSCSIEKLIVKRDRIPNNSIVYEFLTIAKRFKDAQSKVLNIANRTILESCLMQLGVETPKTDDQIIKLRSSVAAKYPLLKAVGLFVDKSNSYLHYNSNISWDSDNVFPHVVEYIQLIEKKYKEQVNG